MEQFRYFMTKMTRKRDKLISTLAPQRASGGGQADLRFQIIQKVGQLLDTTDEKQLCSLQSSLNTRIEQACTDQPTTSQHDGACADQTCRHADGGASTQ